MKLYDYGERCDMFEDEVREYVDSFKPKLLHDTAVLVAYHSEHYFDYSCSFSFFKRKFADKSVQRKMARHISNLASKYKIPSLRRCPTDRLGNRTPPKHYLKRFPVHGAKKAKEMDFMELMNLPSIVVKKG
jgi:spore germination cell wall hydrolase CwlJ-like protein